MEIIIKGEYIFSLTKSGISIRKSFVEPKLLRSEVKKLFGKKRGVSFKIVYLEEEF